MSLFGKVVIVTGASTGIGATTAEAFAKLGSKVVLVGRNEVKLRSTAAACKLANKEADQLVINADVTTKAEYIIGSTIQKFGQLHVLVNNAGIFDKGNILNVDVDQFDRILNTNLRSVFLLTKYAAPHLVKTQGNIVNVSSVAGLRSFVGMSSYCTSKAALDQFTRCVALDLALKNVRVNAVNPGVVGTDIGIRNGMTVEDYAAYLEKCKDTHPLGRVGVTKEVADAIIFLASDSSSFITGASLPIDGGKHACCPRIGASAAEAFAKQGSKVVIVGRNEAHLKATEAVCKAVNSKAELLSVIADVAVDAERIINSTIERFGQLDVLVNNAGIAASGNILDIGVEQFDNILNTNLRAVFLLTKHAAPHLIKTQGNIVNVSSVAGLRSFPGVSVYCTSKAALDQFTRCIALDLAPKNVRVNGVNPGVIITDIHRRSGMSTKEYANYIERSKETHAFGRVGSTKEVADAIIFLASDQSSFITGATLPIDGGKHAMCPR